MEEWTSGVKTAVAAIILVIIIGIVVIYLNLGYLSSESSQETISGQLSNLSEKMFQTYNDRTVSGADVLAAVEQFRGTDIGILIEYNSEDPITVIGPSISDCDGWGKNATYYYKISGGKLIYVDITSKLYDKTSTRYINPTKKYYAVNCRTEAGAIIGICFYLE